MKFLSYEEEKKLNNSELLKYYNNLRKYYILKQNKFKTKLHEILHPLVKILMKTTKNFDIEILNPEKLKRNGTTIYAVNHSNYHDIPTMCEIAQKQFYVLLGIQNLRLIDRIVFALNGNVYVDRKNSKDKNLSKEELIKLSINDSDLLIFPEGTWNTTENRLLLPLNWGIIDIAKISGAVIKPINLEYIGKKCYINVGDDITVEIKDDKYEKIKELETSMATLKWITLEQMGVKSRNDITYHDYETYTEERYKEYPKLNREYESSVIRKVYDTEEEVFSHLKTLKLNKNNAFLGRTKSDYINTYKKS